jgi:chitin synthase
MDISFSDQSISTSFHQLNEDRSQNALPKHTTSLIRPERSRIDPQHPQYHTRRRVLENETNQYRSAGDRSHPTRRSALRRGLLRREEDEEEDEKRLSSNQLGTEYPPNASGISFDMWTAFCYLVTCCCPSPILKAMGKRHIYRSFLDAYLILSQ